MIILCALLLASYQTSVAAAYESYSDDFPEAINITEFLDTSDNIWTVITTANDSQRCKVDKKEFINRTHYYFSRKHRGPSGFVEEKFRGKFTGSIPPFTSMEVGAIGGAPTGIEELIYQGDRNGCGVFELRNVTRVIHSPCYYLYNEPCWQYRAFDIRVRGYGGNVSAQECLEWFRTEYPKETFTRVLYNNSCNDIGRLHVIVSKRQ
uniref:Lipocalin n=1 Tax=Rhipicephalus zambeziensis TaxID=60191 RepID=A0A224YBV0_9ACAR